MLRNHRPPTKRSMWIVISFWVISFGLIAMGCQTLFPENPAPLDTAVLPPTLEPTGGEGPAPTSARPPTKAPGGETAPAPKPTSAPTSRVTPGGVLLFGTFDINRQQYSEILSPPFTGAFLILKPETAIATLDDARANGFRVLINLAGHRRGYQGADGAFSLEKFNAILDTFAEVDFTPYVADGTLIGHVMMDEPQDASNWNGSPVPYEDIESAAAHSKALWPTLPVGAFGPLSYLQGGAPWVSLDFGVAQYTTRRGEIQAWLKGEVEAGRNSGLGLAVSINALRGDRMQPISAEQLREWGRLLASEPYICGLLLWRYDPAYFKDAAIAPVIAEISEVARQRTGNTCQP